MSRVPMLHLAATAVFTATVVWQTVETRSLAQRLEALESSVPAKAGQERPAPALARRHAEGLNPTSSQALAQADAPSGGADQVADDAEPEAIQAAIDEAVERKAEEKRVSEQEQWVQRSAEGIEYQLEKLAEEHGFDEAAVARARELFVDVLYDSVSLREAMEHDELTVKEAIVEGNTMRRQLRDDLVDTIGEEATEKLGWTIRPGKGWADD